MKRVMLLTGIVLLAVPVSAQESILSGGWSEMFETRPYLEETLEMRRLMTSPETLGADIYGQYRDNKLHTIVFDYKGEQDMSPFGVIIEEDPGAFVWDYDKGSAIKRGSTYLFKSLDEFVFESLSLACTTKIEATEVEIKAEAGIHFIATLRGSISLKYDLATVCPKVLQQSAEVEK